MAGVLHGIKHAHGKPWEAEITDETMIDALEIITVIVVHSLKALNMMEADPTIDKARAAASRTTDISDKVAYKDIISLENISFDNLISKIDENVKQKILNATGCAALKYSITYILSRPDWAEIQLTLIAVPPSSA